MRKIKLLLTTVLLLFTSLLWSQTQNVTGTVTGEDGSPIPNASILVKGSSVGSVSASDGSFSISIPANRNTLIVTAVGMMDKEIELNGRTSISIVMQKADKALAEIVVVGYGSGRKSSSIVGTVDRISAARLKDRPTANAIDGLQGQFPGLQVFTSSGEPSATSSFRLHGIGSLGASSQPLILLDGVQVSNSTIVALNPQDIESYTLLKDASSTSIYGARAANGVLSITTRKGASDQPPAITAGAFYSTSNLINRKIFDSFLNTDELLALQVALKTRTQASADQIKEKFPNDTKWGDVYYKRNAPTKQANLSVSGGKGGTRYYVSGSYFNQEGLTYRSGYERITGRSNVTTTINKWIGFGLNLGVGYSEQETNPYGSNSTNRGLSLLAQPYYSPVDSNGKRYDLIPGWGRYHPEYLADNIQYLGRRYQFNPMGYIELKPFKGFTIKSQAGYDAYAFRESSLRLPSYLGSLGNGSAGEEYSSAVNRTVTNTAEYLFKVLNSHDFSVLAGYEFIDYKYEYFEATSAGQTDDRLVLLSAGPNNRDVDQSKTEYAYESYFGRFTYDYLNKYFFDASLRQDASSRFGINNQKAQFWSLGVMWAAKKEKFLENVDWIDNLNVRFSVGTSGNSSLNNNYLSQALVSTTNYDGAAGWYLGSAGNENLSWEQQKKSLLNIQMSLINRIRMDFSIYSRDTRNQLVNVPYAYTSGYSSIWSNVGSLNNKGFDLRLDVDVIKAANAYFTPYVVLGYNKEKITELFQGRDYWIIPNTGVAWVVGQPITYIYPLWAGVNADNGKPQWYLPADGEGFEVKTQKDPSKVSNSFDEASLQQNTGIRRYAPWTGGFGFQSGWKGFSFNVDFSFQKGKYLINNDNFFFRNPNQFAGFNTQRVSLDYWKEAGDIATFPDPQYRFSEFDDRLIEDASFLRLKTLLLGYDLPKRIVDKSGFIKAARVFLTGRNLITSTQYTGPDPEVDSNLTLGVNPNTRQFGVGIDLQF